MNSKPNSSFPPQPLMATIFHAILLFSSVFSGATAQSKQSNINLRSSLSPTTTPTSWPSPSGQFAIGFYRQGTGFAVGVWLAEPSGNRVIVWTANRDNAPVSSNSSLLLTSEGRLVLRSGGPDTFISAAAEPASFASMLDSGNFALYNSDSQIIWGTFNSPTDTILGGQSLSGSAGEELISSVSETNHSTGRFRIKMQTDGHLVFYPIQTTDTAENSYWASGTNGRGKTVTLHLDDNGFMYLLNDTGFNIYNLTQGYDARVQRTATNIYRATIGFDGIFRLYSHRFERNSSSMSTKWSSTSQVCEVKGLCGLNSYCTLNDTQANCRCPPGFDFVDPSQKSMGCGRNFTHECRGKKEGMKYDIFDMPNTVWKDDPYAILSSITEDGCRQECLLDCHCEAALFKDRNCYKQKLPLQYWRRKLDDSSKAFVKFGTRIGNSGTPDDALKPELQTRTKKEQHKEILILGTGLVAFSLVVLAVLGFLIYRHRIWRYRLLSEAIHNGNEREEFAPRPFRYDELEKATDGFKEELGKGGFGTVYKGVLANGGRVIAVKRLDRVVEEGDREFRTEMRAIGRTHHRNLVRLVGYCVEGSHRLLVYEYMSNGSLANILFSPDRHPNWHEKVRIAMDIARGILYLHEECETPIIHCDIKPQNILMDEFHCAKISDFGLAKMMKPDQTRTFTAVRGTKGYVAPEWHRNMPVTVKADVYSFGIVLLEIVCCRRSVEMEVEESEVVLSDWVYDCFEARELHKLVDGEEVDMKRLERMVKVGLWCIQDEPSLRPSMKKVVLMLEGTVEIPNPPSPTSFLSTI